MYRSIDLRKNALGIFVMLAAIAWIFAAGQHHYDINEVSTQEAKSLIDTGAAVIDVRGPEHFKAGHIPGAMLLPLEVLQRGIPASIQLLKDKAIVVYCGDGVTSGPEGTELLNKAGFAKAVNLKHGMESWTGAGYPVKKG